MTIHDDVAGGLTFIAMEYIDGRAMDQLIAPRAMRFTEALRYTVPAADALPPAHAIGIVHRDVKPSKILTRLEAW